MKIGVSGLDHVLDTPPLLPLLKIGIHRSYSTGPPPPILAQPVTSLRNLCTFLLTSKPLTKPYPNGLVGRAAIDEKKTFYSAGSSFPTSPPAHRFGSRRSIELADSRDFIPTSPMTPSGRASSTMCKPTFLSYTRQPTKLRR